MPPLQKAPCSAANLLSLTGTASVMKYCLTRSGCFSIAVARSQKMTPCSARSALSSLKTLLESTWTVSPARRSSSPRTAATSGCNAATESTRPLGVA